MANGQVTENGLPQRAQTTNPDWDMYEARGHGRTDEQIRADLHERLAREGGEHTRRLSLEVTQGVVTLRGSVSSQAERHRIVALVQSVPSVRDVRDGLSIEAAGSLAPHNLGPAEVRRAHEFTEHAHDYSGRVRDRAQGYVDRARNYTYEAGDRTVTGARDVGEFVATHAIPLVFVGASLAYLAWSVQRDRQLRQMEYPISTVTALLP